MRPTVLLVKFCLLWRTSIAVEDRPRRLPPLGWQRIESKGEAYYYRAHDGVSVWANPYVLGEVLAQILDHLLPAIWSHHARWRLPIELLHRAENLVALGSTLRWANAAADASWECQGGRSGNSAIWHRPRRNFNRDCDPREGTAEPQGQLPAGSSQDPPISHSSGTSQQQQHPLLRFLPVEAGREDRSCVLTLLGQESTLFRLLVALY